MNFNYSLVKFRIQDQDLKKDRWITSHILLDEEKKIVLQMMDNRVCFLP